MLINLTYLKITKDRSMIERQRHTNDIEHPIYEIIDNALSAVDG